MERKFRGNARVEIEDLNAGKSVTPSPVALRIPPCKNISLSHFSIFVKYNFCTMKILISERKLNLRKKIARRAKRMLICRERNCPPPLAEVPSELRRSGIRLNVDIEMRRSLVEARTKRVREGTWHRRCCQRRKCADY